MPKASPHPSDANLFLAAGGDLFVNRQALAILEGNDSIVDSSLGSSAPDPDGPQFAPQVGTKIGRYRVGTLLGSGATGAVYAGFDEELNRAVAIKFFSSGRHANSGTRVLPMREARAASLSITPTSS